MDYLKRIADEQLTMKLDAFGGVLITGPKGCGKTTTAKQKASLNMPGWMDGALKGKTDNARLSIAKDLFSQT